MGIITHSLVDYPKEISAVIYIGGCNMKCPFCHNGSLVNPSKKDELKWNDVLEKIIKTKKYVTAVVFTGGEPTLDNKLLQYVKEVKENGFKVKIDTNGTKSKVLKELIPLIDYVAID